MQLTKNGINSIVKKAMTEKHTIERTYYYDFGFSGQEPDYESMTAFLLDKGIVHLSEGTSCNHESAACLFINVNDYFVPAADGEDLPFSDIPKLFDMCRKDGYNGVYQYVADKRGVPNKHWRDK